VELAAVIGDLREARGVVFVFEFAFGVAAVELEVDSGSGRAVVVADGAGDGSAAQDGGVGCSYGMWGDCDDLEFAGDAFLNVGRRMGEQSALKGEQRGEVAGVIDAEIIGAGMDIVDCEGTAHIGLHGWDVVAKRGVLVFIIFDGGL